MMVLSDGTVPSNNLLKVLSDSTQKKYSKYYWAMTTLLVRVPQYKNIVESFINGLQQSSCPIPLPPAPSCILPPHPALHPLPTPPAPFPPSLNPRTRHGLIPVLLTGLKI